MHEDAADVFEFALVTCVMTCAITKHDTRLLTSAPGPRPTGCTRRVIEVKNTKKKKI